MTNALPFHGWTTQTLQSYLIDMTQSSAKQAVAQITHRLLSLSPFCLGSPFSTTRIAWISSMRLSASWGQQEKARLDGWPAAVGPLRAVSSAGAGLAIFKRSFDYVLMNSASILDTLTQAPIGLHSTGQCPLHLRGLGHVTNWSFEKRQLNLSFVLVL